MYAQFFLARDSWCFAWGALLLITIMSLATQILAVLIVKWNGRFFNRGFSHGFFTVMTNR